MKKSMLVLAVLAAFAGVAHAQSSVTLYGVLDMAIQNENTGAPASSKTTLDSGQQSGSRLGFKGTEDLGNGLKANFLLEMGVLADTGASQAGLTFGRQSYVGLSGDFGAINLGRQYAPIFNAAAAVDPFGVAMIGGHAGVSTSSAGTLGGLGIPFRTDNTINYTTNSIEGFTGSLAYAFGEVAGDTSKSSQIGASGKYAAGPVVGVIAYNSAKNTLAQATKKTYVGATYDFGMVKAAAAYSATTTDANTVDNKIWMVGAIVPLSSADSLLASYISAKNNLAATNGRGAQFAVGITHSLSKRTNFYTSFSRASNDANSNIAGLAAGNGLTERLFNVGIRHTF